MNLSFFKSACQKTFKTPWPNRRAFSMVELLTVIAVIGALSLMAVPHYIEYKKRPYEAWVAKVLAEQSKFLKLAYSIDGGYHQYLTDMGWIPQGSQLGQVGFRLLGSDPPCCNIYPDPNSASEAAFQHFTYIKRNPGGAEKTAAGTRTRSACKKYPEVCVFDRVDQVAINTFNIVGITERPSAPCNNFIIKDAYCSCDAFTLMGITNYDDATSKANTIKQGSGILVLDQKGQLCKADKKTNGQLKIWQ